MSDQILQAEYTWIALALTGAGIGIAYVIYKGVQIARYQWLRWRIRKILREIPSVACPPRVASVSPQTSRAQVLHPVASHADRVSAIGDQESGLLTTTLRRVK